MPRRQPQAKSANRSSTLPAALLAAAATACLLTACGDLALLRPNGTPVGSKPRQPANTTPTKTNLPVAPSEDEPKKEQPEMLAPEAPAKKEPMPEEPAKKEPMPEEPAKDTPPPAGDPACAQLTYKGQISNTFNTLGCNVGCHSQIGLALGTYADVAMNKDLIVKSLTENCKDDENARDCMKDEADNNEQAILDWIQKCNAQE